MNTSKIQANPKNQGVSGFFTGDQEHPNGSAGPPRDRCRDEANRIPVEREMAYAASCLST